MQIPEMSDTMLGFAIESITDDLKTKGIKIDVAVAKKIKAFASKNWQKLMEGESLVFK